MVTVEDVQRAMQELGIREGDSVVVHSSFKSLGEVENGADTVITGLLRTVGESGTVIFPTLCQEDWEHVYENWHLDAESHVGYLTNYFRKLPEARRSNQATHSVAAIGKHAAYITETHGESGLRHGIYGDTPFAADSPWEKMYQLNTKVVFIGCWVRSCTMRHLAEYQFMEKMQKKAAQKPNGQELIDRVWCYERWNDRGVWWHVESLYVEKLLAEQGKAKYTTCGNAKLLLVPSKNFVDISTELMENRDMNGFQPKCEYWDPQETIDWLKEVDA